MKYQVRGNPWVKFLALLLSTVLGVIAVFGAYYCLVNWEVLFEAGDHTSSPAWAEARYDMYNRLSIKLHYDYRVLQGQELTYMERQNYDFLCQRLAPAVTNFRYTVRDNATGRLLDSSFGEDTLQGVEDLCANTMEFARSPQDDRLAAQAVWVIEYGVDPALSADDAFSEAARTFTYADPLFFYLTQAAALGWLACGVFLLCCAGRRPGREEAVLNWSDKVPFDLYLLVVGTGIGLALGTGVAIFQENFPYHSPGLSVHRMWYSLFALLLAAAFLLLDAAAMSAATRCKTRTLLKNTLVWRVCAWLWGCVVWLWRLLARSVRHIFDLSGSLELSLRVILTFLGYLFLNAFLAFGLFLGRRPGPFSLLLLLVNIVVLGLICRWTRQWSKVRTGTQAIVGGQPDTVIDTADMQWFPSLREHAAALNDLGSAINTAVEERLRSERMKAELITNVSHDLKTPLTSIINYVDLLKKEDIQGEKAREYIEVLDRKSQRLKKLTEDLVEASKASTGSLPVVRERLGFTQLVEQALGEYTERFAAVSLAPVVSLPQEEVYVSADGRYVWRILDNLMGNCVKYALPGTRVYLDVAAWDGYVTLSLKNVSAQQLNIPAEQLMERFVRGDESRTTEGSGLGLSIARSLCELQGGLFRLEVDGDLFKAVVSLPQVK